MRILRTIVICLGLAAAAAGQVTSVSGTVTDPNGIPYAGGTIRPVFVNVSGGATPTLNGNPVIAPPTTTLDSTGAFSMGLADNGTVLPAATHWNFIVCSASGSAPVAIGKGSLCFQTGNITITGASQDITQNLQATAVALTNLNYVRTLGTYQGQTNVGITDAAFHALIAASSDIAIRPNFISTLGQKLHIVGSGVYTNAAASVLNLEVMLCQVSGCASGTVVVPAGCVVTSTNQANTLTNGQFLIDCRLTAATAVGAAGRLMAQGDIWINLGATTGAALSSFQDTQNVVGSPFDETVQLFVNIGFKFTTANAGNSASVLEAHVEALN